MKLRAVFVLAFLFTVNVSVALAGRADGFRGWYEVLSPREGTEKNFLVLDTDSLGALWAKYAKTPLPADLEPSRADPTLIAFVPINGKNVLFLAFERVALISPTYLSVPGNQGGRLELKRAGDGTFEAAVQNGSAVTRLRLAAPVPPPSGER